jgi:hypothetical protein
MGSRTDHSEAAKGIAHPHLIGYPPGTGAQSKLTARLAWLLIVRVAEIV